MLATRQATSHVAGLTEAFGLGVALKGPTQSPKKIPGVRGALSALRGSSQPLSSQLRGRGSHPFELAQRRRFARVTASSPGGLPWFSLSHPLTAQGREDPFAAGRGQPLSPRRSH